MFIAERFLMSLVYGAALFFSLSAFIRILGFSVKTPFDPGWLKIIKSAAALFFILSAAYLLVLYPFLFVFEHSVYAIALIALPFAEREAENFILKRLSKTAELKKRDIIKRVIPVELFFIAAAGLIALAADTGAFSPVTAGMALGMALNLIRQVIYRDYATDYPRTSESSLNMREVRSARLYEGMAITSGAALNIFAFTYILFIMLSGRRDFFLDFLVVFGGLSLVFTVVYLATHRSVNSALIHKIGKNAAFILGTAVSIFAVYVFRDSWYQGPLIISIKTLLLLFGLILQMTAALGLKEDVLLVLRLYDQRLDEAALKERMARLEVWSAAISEAIFIIVLLIIISNPFFYMMDVSEYIEYAPYVGASVAVIPAFFLVASLVYSIKQPLTKKFGSRLKAYFSLRKRGWQNPDMEKRLRSVLIKKYKKRIGVYIIRAFLKGVMYHCVTGREHVTELPGVFVFNHGELYGPIAAVVFLPYDIRPWILDKMIDKKRITDHIYDGTFARIAWLPVFLRKFIAKALSPIIVWALRSFEPVPVYRGAGRDILKTFKLSIECLNSGDSILLFPENPEEDYGEKVSEFYSGFAGLGRMYHRDTGRSVTFYPVFASKRSRILRIGAGVTYDAEGKSEKDRIVKTLRKSMAELQSLDE